MRQIRSGYTTVEAMIVVAVTGIVSAIAIPALGQLHRRVQLRKACGEVKMILLNARDEAVTLDRSRGVKFSEANGQWSYAVYEDGNNNGVRNADIRSGKDPMLRGPYPLLYRGGHARIGLPTFGVVDPDNGLPLTGASPVNFNRSTIASFSSSGDGTPGTVFLTVAGTHTAAVRCSGDGGVIRILYYDSGRQKWHSG
jgi:type II secretory pathway pseudopilin PulG